MIEDGHITYPNFNSPLYNWRPESNFLSDCLVGILTTVFIYQTLRICLDLGTGFKKHGEIRGSDIGVYIMVSESSFRSFAKAAGKLKLCAPQSARQKTLRSIISPGSKTLLLLCIALFIRTGIIALTIENEKTLSFGDVGFRGVGLGIVADPSQSKPVTSSSDQVVKYSRPGRDFCYRNVPTKYARSEEPLAKFYRCSTFFYYNNSASGHENLLSSIDNNPSTAFFHIHAGLNESIVMQASSQELRIVSRSAADMLVGRKSYIIKNTVSTKEAAAIIRAILDSFLHCPQSADKLKIEKPPPALRGRDVPGVGPGWHMYAAVSCRKFTFTEIYGAFQLFERSIKFVNTETLELKTDAGTVDPKLVKDFPFLQRTSAPLSLVMLIILVVVITSVRLFISFALGNDSHLAPEIVFKDALGIKCCDSILQEQGLLHYGDKLWVQSKGKKGISNDAETPKPEHVQNKSSSLRNSSSWDEDGPSCASLATFESCHDSFSGSGTLP